MHRLVLVLTLVSHGLAFAGSAKSPRLGERWNKRPAQESEVSRSVFHIELFLASATATYLGNHNGKDLFLTVNHIVGDICGKLSLTNAALAPKARWHCDKVLFQQNDIDTAIIAASSDDDEAMALLHTVQPSRLSAEPPALRTPLELLGFGAFENPQRILKEENGPTCVTLAPYAPNLIHDPDRVWTAPHPIWSMPIGCASSPGDSGGPAFRRGTNQITGIVWTGGARGSDLKDENLIRVYEKAPRRLWTDFTYMVPAPLILERISAQTANRELSECDRRTLRELLLGK